MQRFWEFILGIEPASWTEGGSWSLEWLALPSSDGMLVLLGLVLAGLIGLWWLYRWEGAHVPVHTRFLLAGLRVTAVLLAAAMLLEPVIVLSKEEWIPSNLIVLIDSSQSMGLRDAWRDEDRGRAVAAELGLDGGLDELRGETRLDLARRMLDDETLAGLEAGGDRTVHVHTFADRLDDAPEASGSWRENLEPRGETTALGAAIRQALLTYAGLPLAGLLVISDGQSTAGDTVEAAAALAADEGVPVAAVGVGTPEGPRNAAIFKLEASPTVFVRDANRLSVHVQSRGMQDMPATLLVEQRVNGGPWQEIAREDLILGLEGQLQTAELSFSEVKPCKLEFRASLADVGPELTTDDNVAFAEVRVIRQRLRVLFVAGSTFPEVQFLQNTFLRDRRIEASSWLMAADKTYEHPGDIPIRRLPVTQEELDDFDCVVLYDPDPNGWPVNFPELLMNFVSKAGGGLVYIAGEMQTAGLFDRQSEPEMAWLSMLPVVREPGLFRSAVQMRLSARSPWKLKITERGKRDPIFAFSDDPAANQRILESLPGMFWHFPVTRAKPGAAVLAVHGDPRMRNEYGPEVLLATQLVGPGRTIFIGFDSTYRWRFLDEQFFDGFWARVVDRAGRNKQLGGNYPFRLSTARSVYRPGSQVKLIARFNDVSQIEPGLEALYGEVERGDDEPLPLTLSAGDELGEFAATFTATRPGTHFIRVWMGDEAAGAVVKAATLPLEVQLPNLEYENPTLDTVPLEAATEATGGRLFDVTESDELADAFKITRVSRVLEDRQEIWDAPLIFSAIFLLLVAEWLLRKRWRLI